MIDEIDPVPTVLLNPAVPVLDAVPERLALGVTPGFLAGTPSETDARGRAPVEDFSDSVGDVTEPRGGAAVVGDFTDVADGGRDVVEVGSLAAGASDVRRAAVVVVGRAAAVAGLVAPVTEDAGGVFLTDEVLVGTPLVEAESEDLTVDVDLGALAAEVLELKA